MEKIQFDSGIREYRLNGMGALRFNPGDPNLYARFMEAADRIGEIEKELALQAQAEGASLAALLQSADRRMKETLGWVFGPGNDFDKLLGGVSLLAVASNGERVVTNLFAALEPVLVSGAESMTRQKTDEAVAKARHRRATQ
ncbi:MAG: hypothetical protein J6B67_00330 [Oscillospiraceae bacterium]|nr:hypothetical protein [Oscillospiraceae bacterium]